jgi:hypothetical protein
LIVRKESGMTNTQAVQTVKEHYSGYKDLVSIDRKSVNKELFKEIMNVCNNTRYIEELIDWYDDEGNKDFCNWQDVEGEGYGWLWVNKPESKWHGLIVDSLKRFIKQVKKEKRNNMECIFVQLKDKVIYHFIDRDINECDYIYTFSNDELHY